MLEVNPLPAVAQLRTRSIASASANARRKYTADILRLVGGALSVEVASSELRREEKRPSQAVTGLTRRLAWATGFVRKNLGDHCRGEYGGARQWQWLPDALALATFEVEIRGDFSFIPIPGVFAPKTANVSMSLRRHDDCETTMRTQAVKAIEAHLRAVGPESVPVRFVHIPKTGGTALAYFLETCSPLIRHNSCPQLREVSLGSCLWPLILATAMHIPRAASTAPSLVQVVKVRFGCLQDTDCEWHPEHGEKHAPQYLSVQNDEHVITIVRHPVDSYISTAR